MCLYLHTDMYVEHINTRGHERICPYQIIEKNTLNAANLQKQFSKHLHVYICRYILLQRK